MNLSSWGSKEAMLHVTYDPSQIFNYFLSVLRAHFIPNILYNQIESIRFRTIDISRLIINLLFTNCQAINKFALLQRRSKTNVKRLKIISTTDTFRLYGPCGKHHVHYVIFNVE